MLVFPKYQEKHTNFDITLDFVIYFQDIVKNVNSHIYSISPVLVAVMVF